MNKHQLMIFLMLQPKENPSRNWALHQLQCQRENLPDNSSNLARTQIPTFLSWSGNCVILQDVFIFINQQRLK